MLIGHQKQWNFLRKNFEENRLSHAYLFAGLEEIGKKKFALEFIKLINCQAGDFTGNKKEQCRDCKSIGEGKHPDVLMVYPEKGGEIQISQIRDVQKFLSLKPYYSSFKAIIVDEAEKMNKESQGCFLKTLEEPKGNTILILISSKPQTLLATILSRCQLVKFFVVPQKEIKDFFLKEGVAEKKAEELSVLAEGKPARAIKLFSDKVLVEKEKKTLEEFLTVCDADFSSKFQYVKNLPEGRFKDVITIFKRYLRGLLFLKLGMEGFSGSGSILTTSEKLKTSDISKIKKIIELTEKIDFYFMTTNINQKLALEILLMEI